MSSVLMPICKECSHYEGSNVRNGKWALTCTAYPDGIPRDIIHSIADHTKPLPGDHGIQFDPIDPNNVGKKTHNLLLKGYQ